MGVQAVTSFQEKMHSTGILVGLAKNNNIVASDQKSLMSIFPIM